LGNLIEYKKPTQGRLILAANTYDGILSAVIASRLLPGESTRLFAPLDSIDQGLSIPSLTSKAELGHLLIFGFPLLSDPNACADLLLKLPPRKVEWLDNHFWRPGDAKILSDRVPGMKIVVDPKRTSLCSHLISVVGKEDDFSEALVRMMEGGQKGEGELANSRRLFRVLRASRRQWFETGDTARVLVRGELQALDDRLEYEGMALEAAEEELAHSAFHRFGPRDSFVMIPLPSSAGLEAWSLTARIREFSGSRYSICFFDGSNIAYLETGWGIPGKRAGAFFNDPERICEAFNTRFEKIAHPLDQGRIFLILKEPTSQFLTELAEFIESIQELF